MRLGSLAAHTEPVRLGARSNEDPVDASLGISHGYCMGRIWCIHLVQTRS